MSPLDRAVIRATVPCIAGVVGLWPNSTPARSDFARSISYGFRELCRALPDIPHKVELVLAMDHALAIGLSLEMLDAYRRLLIAGKAGCTMNAFFGMPDTWNGIDIKITKDDDPPRLIGTVIVDRPHPQPPECVRQVFQFDGAF